jgi:hypothetical protein
MSSLAQDAAAVSRFIGRDEQRKRVILTRSPHLAFALDANQIAEMSSRELASRELKELGIEPGDNDPLALLDAHHSGRSWERQRATTGRAPSAMDSDATPNFIDKYLKE